MRGATRTSAASKPAASRETHEKEVHFAPVAVAVMQHVLDIGVFLKIFSFLLFFGFGYFHVEVAHLLNAGVDLAEFTSGESLGLTIRAVPVRERFSC